MTLTSQTAANPEIAKILADLEALLGEPAPDPLANLLPYAAEADRLAELPVYRFPADRASRRRSFRVPNCRAGQFGPATEPAINFRAFKVGGLRFVRLGQFQVSFCRTHKPIRRA